MAGTLGSNNPYPSLLITEGTVPTTPAAGKQRLYIDSTTHVLKTVNSSGTAANVATAASGSITASGYTQSTAKMLGRSTASTGAIEEITVGTGLTLSGGSLTASGGTISVVATHNSSDLSITSGAERVLTMNTEDRDPDGYHDTVTNNNRFTIPTGKGGGFLVSWDMRFSAAPGDGYFVGRTNGSTITVVSNVFSASGASVTTTSGSQVVVLADADYLEFKMLTSNTVNVQAAGSGIWVSMIKLW